jgi:zinc transporter, ZIP family
MFSDSANIFLLASLTAVATGVGALPFLFLKDFSKSQMAVANAVAAGLMLSASFSLLAEGTNFSAWKTLLGALLGLLMVVEAHRVLLKQKGASYSIAGLPQADFKKILLIVGIMTVHSAAEGVSVGVSFGDTVEFGVLITLAIALHNIPEGLAIALILIPRGISVWKSAGWAVFTSLPQPLLAVPAFLLVTFFQPFLPIGLGLAAGAMIWMTFEELVPEALEGGSRSLVSVTMTLAILSFVLFQLVLNH